MILIHGAKRVYRRLKLLKTRYRVINPDRNMPQIDRSLAADRRRQGFSILDSFCYDLKSNDYHDYISTWEEWQPGRTHSPYFKISGDKYLFACGFGPYITVPHTYGLIEDGRLLGIEPAGLEGRDLYDFLVRHGGGCVKDRYGCGGFRVYPLSEAGGKLFYRGKALTRPELSAMVEGLPHGLIQSRMTQGRFENAVFDRSVNTVRILSAQKPGGVKHEVIAALHRFGTSRSAPVDNFRQGGLSALIDIGTGRLGKAAGLYETDASGRHIFLERHPDTGAPIEGQTVPNWEALKKTVADLTRALPFLELIAWDFIVQDQGFALVEINMKSDLDLFQIHGGARHSLLGEKYREHGYLVEKWG